jgi:hypothetical protein
MEKERLRENILTNVNKPVLPLLNKLPLEDYCRHYKKLLEERLNNLT